jgi:CBS domain-containing protein
MKTGMRVDQIMTRSVHSCRAGETLSDAAQIMWDTDCGCVPIVSDDASGRVVGILTDRDICMALHFRGRAPRDVAICDVMSTAVRTVAPTQDLEDAEKIMREAQIRRLPVVDDEQRLVGILALADLAQEAARERGASGRPALTEEEIGDTYSAISVSRIPSQLVATA